MLRVAEAFWRLGLRILFEDPMLGPNQAGHLRFPPTFSNRMNARPPIRMSTANPTTITFRDREFRRKIAWQGQGIAGFEIGITTFGEFASDFMDDSFDGLD